MKIALRAYESAVCTAHEIPPAAVRKRHVVPHIPLCCMSWQQFSLARVRVCVDNGGVMTMNEQITEGMKTAMRAKDFVALGALRGLKAAIQNARLAKGSVNAELTPAEEQSVVRKQIKQREDAIALYAQAGRTEQVEKEQAEITILAALLPKEMTEAEIMPLLEAVIAELGATSKKDMGRVMKEMQARTEGRAPGKLLSQLVGSRLN